ncbi:MAG: XRE family transcriptional regulator [Oscillospiraceae bacterium]
MKNLPVLRKKMSLTQAQFAKKFGVSTSTVAMWETGQRKPDYHTIIRLCDFFAVGFEELLGVEIIHKAPVETVPIPILGFVRAGSPNYACEEVIGYEKINEELSKTGEFFALKIRGDSMEPKISDGDIVIVKRQPTVENGQTAVVMVGNEEATVKKVICQKQGMTLVPTNPDFLPMYYTPLECENLPVTVVGLVIELRSPFV